MNTDIFKRIFLLLVTFVMLMQFCFAIVYFSPDAPLQPLSFSEAYFYYFEHLFQGDLALSFKNSHDLFLEIKESITITFELFFLSLFLSVIVGIPIGIYAGIKQKKWQNSIIKTGGLLISASSIIWIAIWSQSYFPLPSKTDFLSTQQSVPSITGFFFIDIWFDNIPEKFHYFLKMLGDLMLPISVLALYWINVIVYFLSASTAIVINKNYIKIALIRGTPHWKIIYRHVLPNALTPIIPQLILHFSFMLFLTMIIEIIFNLPGLGYWILQGHLAQDYINISSAILIIGMIIIAFNLISNIIGVIINPLKYKDWYVYQ